MSLAREVQSRQKSVGNVVSLQMPFFLRWCSGENKDRKGARGVDWAPASRFDMIAVWICVFFPKVLFFVAFCASSGSQEAFPGEIPLRKERFCQLISVVGINCLFWRLCV